MTPKYPAIKTTNHIQARSQFLRSFSALQQQFDAIQRTTYQHEQDLMQDQKQVANKLEQLANGAQGHLADNHPLSQLSHKWLEDTRQVTQQWLKASQQFDKGTSLNDRRKGSFVTYVLGKVNSGKSSMGNFIATGKHKPTEEQVKALATQGLSFVLHDQSDVQTRKKQDLKQGFVVDDQECTSSVQYFTLPGLTWVDVPGLHSKNAANGVLAQEYLQSADLVVYVMNAEHPARESDMDEIRNLLKMNKPLVFVTTCSDEIVTDEVDGQLIKQREMYSQQDRKDQNQYLLDTLQRHFGDHPGLKQVHAISVSVHYAEEAGDDQDKLEDSGMLGFLRMMTSLIERDSVALKKQTPTKNLAHFAQRLIDASQTLNKQHQQINQELQQLQSDVQSRYQAMVGQLTSELNPIISAAMENYSGDNKALSRKISEPLNTAFNTLLQRQLEEQLTHLEGAVGKAFSFDSSDALPGFKHEYETFTYSDRGKKSAWGSAGGSAAGAAAGFAVGGPVGALVGGFLGGWLGGKAGSAMGETHRQQVIIGDNRYQVEEAAYKLFSQRIQQQLEESYRAPMLQVIGQLNNTLQQFEAELKGFCQRTQRRTGAR